MKNNIKAAGIVMTAVLLITGCGVQNSAASVGSSTESIVANTESAVNSTESVAISSTEVIQETESRITLTRNSQYPDYYETEVIKTIRTIESTATGDSVNYIFITDFHLDNDEISKVAAYRQLNAVVDIANNSDIDFVCVGGDIYNGRHAEENGKQNAMEILRSVSEILKECNKPVFILHGNHDDNSFSAQIDGNLLYDADYIINKEEWYSVTMAYFSSYATDYQDGYFYYDLPGKNTRVICLNMSDSDDTVVDGMQAEMGMHFYGYKDRQIDWLLNKAMTREDCKYLIMSHDAFDYPEGYSAVSNRDTLKNILSAAYTHQNYDDGKFSKNFSEWNANLVLYNSGHLHMERTYFDPSMGGLPILNTEKAKVSVHGVWGSFGPTGYRVEMTRTANTVSE
ncbi:MAG: metallophosphoesterase, partial [Clostridia bacterium]|nr:metallophosphoesterase [Clostridia bacterium]